ncbi:hypothetical protein [Kitasatospora mediocidica]|uniref:hypothetical protein n=1 Tax=Kitasatospora mediocidica TaxID=58352 RepID=UPI00056ADA86|nr:hypothetical protein [Kitasatospora mediocidica]
MMTIDQLAVLATFGSVWAVLAVSHNLADHVFGQSDHQAANKGAPAAEDVAAGASPRRGWAACLAHVGQRPRWPADQTPARLWISPDVLSWCFP